MSYLTLPDCSSDFECPHPDEEFQHLFGLVVDQFVPPKDSEPASLLTFAQLISLCSENKSAPPPEPHADTSFLNSDKSIIKPISVNDHVQEGPLPEKSAGKALSFNEHVLL
ncbi:hypothetical protein PVAP13_5KG527107 [Panicum virgatum]|uniref:Uncharacterized protein n=1 Tax=Panicum virgatum TaxID=38727 RepID=A0A8T0SPF8_PANVG|nr:hypothetical protein PVAP13_5KG527107 [Panicum virgatum]